MLAEELTRLKQELKLLLPEEGMATVVKALKGHFPSDAPKYNALLQIEARLNEANLKRIKGILSEDQLQLQYNQLRDDLLNFIDELKPEDFSKEAAKKSKTGSILYNIPRKMEIQKRSKCIVRLAYDESIIIQNIELTADTTLQSVRISEAMEVALIDPAGGKSFDIQSISSPEQFLEEDDYSEWLFYVTPLAVGEHPLVLKVSVIELIGGKERKKEIVLEEFVTIITQPVKEEEVAKPFKNAGYQFAMGGVGILDNMVPEKSQPSPSYTPGKTAAVMKKYSMALGAFAMLIVISWALGLFEFIYWQEVKWSDTVEDYQEYLLKYPNGRFFDIARQHRDLKTAINLKSDSLIVEFLADYPDSELKLKAESTYYQLSDKNLNERLRKRKAEKEKEKNKRSPETDKRTENKTSGSQSSAPVQTLSEKSLQNGDLADKPGNNSSPADEGLPGTKNAENEFLEKGAPEPGSTTREEKLKISVPTNLEEKPVEGFPTSETILKALSWLEANMVMIEGGKFMMGCDESKDDCNSFNVPHREVKVSSFELCRYEVTQVLWQSIMGYNPAYVEIRNCPMCPIEYVSFREVQEFIKRLNKRTGKKFRLPTEAEWEFAARGGNQNSGTIYAGSNNAEEVAWFQKNSRHRPQLVGKKKPNSLGLHDMSGGVFEWCEDTWHSNYENAPSKGDAWMKKGFENNRVIRGGSWLDDPSYLRVDYRDMDVDSLRNHITGFRLARG